ncbi:MAG: DegV family protein, partial [Coriobacteriales bacterium]
MRRVAIVTDSAANLPPELAQENNIHVVPLTLVWGDETFLDGVDLSPEEFYHRLATDDRRVTTSAFTPEQLIEVCDGLASQGYDIVALLLARELSSCLQEAEAVQRMRPDLPLHVVDTRTAAPAEGFIVLEAARAAAAGASVDEVIARAREVGSRSQILAVVETLEYLRRGGRIGSAAALLGTMLQVKPIVGISPGHGSVEGVARPHTWHSAVEEMLELTATAVGDRPVHMAISHGDKAEAAEELSERIRQRFDVVEMFIT